MNKVIDTSTRLFLAIVGPSGSGKTELIFKLFRSNVPRSEVVFMSQMVFILILLAFCIFKLSLTQLTREETSVWFSILSGLVGYVLPNPRI